jgi:hypothetical protein
VSPSIVRDGKNSHYGLQEESGQLSLGGRRLGAWEMPFAGR